VHGRAVQIGTLSITTYEALMVKPNDVERTVPKPVAHGDKTATGATARHAMQRSGYQKADEQGAETVTYPQSRAVRRQPGKTTRGE
jgi:hypothetical protein